MRKIINTILLDFFTKKSNIFSILFILFLCFAIYIHAAFDLLLTTAFFLTAYSVGTFITIKGSSKLFLIFISRILFGVLAVTLFVWCATLFPLPHREIFCILSATLIWMRRKHLLFFIKNVRRVYSLHVESSPQVLVIFLAVIVLFFTYASQPISQPDALSAHLPIVSKIVSEGKQSYNVVESIIFSNTDRMMHMSGVWLYYLGGTKSLVYFNAVFSIVVLVSLLMMLRKSTPAPRSTAILAIMIYGFTPVIFQQSVIYYQDILPVAFLFLVLNIILSCSLRTLNKNIFLVMFLAGGVFFAKRTGIYMVICAVVGFTVANVFFICKERNRDTKSFLMVILSIFLFIAVPAGPLLIVWHKTGNPLFPFMNGYFKSVYYSAVNFKDPFSHPLGFNFSSLLSIVFHPELNMEIGSYGVGVHLLLLPLSLLVSIVKRDTKWILIFLLCIATYFLSTRTTYNIRYFFSSIVLSVPMVAYAFGNISYLFMRRNIRYALFGTLLVILMAPCFGYLFGGRYRLFTPPLQKLIHPHDKLESGPFDKLYEKILDKNASIFLNYTSPLRGAYSGFFVSYSWYNDYILRMLREKQMSMDELFNYFDYVISLDSVSEYIMDLSFFVQNGTLESIHSAEGFILYKVSHKEIDFKEILGTDFAPPVVIYNTKKRLFAFEHQGSALRVTISAKVNVDGVIYNNIDWFNKSDGALISTTSTPIKLKQGKYLYASEIDTSTFQNSIGVISAVGEYANPVIIYSYKLAIKQKNPIEHALEDYNKKWPYN